MPLNLEYFVCLFSDTPKPSVFIKVSESVDLFCSDILYDQQIYILLFFLVWVPRYLGKGSNPTTDTTRNPAEHCSVTSMCRSNQWY